MAIKPVRATRQIELHDTAIRTFARQLLMADPRPGVSADISVPVVYATPERAHAKMDKLLAQFTQENTPRDAFVKYPFISIYRNNVLELDPLRHNAGWMGASLGYEGDPWDATAVLGTGDGSTTAFGGSAIVFKVPIQAGTVRILQGDTEVATDDGNGNISDPSPGGAVSGTVDYVNGIVDVLFTTAPAQDEEISVLYNHDAKEIGFLGKWPYPFNFHYVVDFWLRYEETKAEIAENFAVGPVANHFNPFELFVEIDYGKPWGNKIVPVTNWRWLDNSDLIEGAKETDRVYRYTLEFDLKGWLHLNPVDGNGPRIYIVHEIRSEFFLVDPGAGYDPLARTVDLIDVADYPTADADEIIIVNTEDI